MGHHGLAAGAFLDVLFLDEVELGAVAGQGIEDGATARTGHHHFAQER